MLRPEAVPGRKATVVELRSSGLMTVVPPSLHPHGERLVWERWGEPGQVPAHVLRDAVGRLALAALLRARGWSGADAISLARLPAAEALRAAASVLGDTRTVSGWLGLQAREERPRGTATRSGGELLHGRASPLTEAVLLRLGGVLGAGRLLGLPLREGRQPCPFHGGASRRTFEVTRHAWRCWAGCGQGNAIHLVAKALRVDYREARAWLAGQLHLGSRSHPPLSRR